MVCQSGNAWHTHIRITRGGYLQGVACGEWADGEATRKNAGTLGDRGRLLPLLGLDYESEQHWNLEGEVRGVHNLEKV